METFHRHFHGSMEINYSLLNFYFTLFICGWCHKNSLSPSPTLKKNSFSSQIKDLILVYCSGVNKRPACQTRRQSGKYGLLILQKMAPCEGLKQEVFTQDK